MPVRHLLADRHHGMDWLRIGAFQLLILYHVGMAFVPWPYEIKVVAPSLDWAAIPMMLTNPWRLSLLFVVSGYASAALLARDGSIAGFVRGRLARLGIPLLFAMAVLVTPQPWIALVAQHGYRHGFVWFLVHDYYRFQTIDGIAMPTWMHLWFVAYLLVYTLLFALLLSAPRRWRRTGKRLAETMLAGPLLIPLPMLYVWAVRSFVAPGWSDSHRLIDDGSAHLAYFACFLFGVLLRRSAPLREAIARQWRAAAVLALLGYGALVAGELAYPGRTPLPPDLELPYQFARAIEMWGAIIALIGLADRHLNVDGRWRRMLAEAVFPFYIIHQTLILLIGYWLLPTPTGPLARFAILVLGTAAGCWGFYLFGRRIAWLRPLIGLRPAAPTGLRAYERTLAD